ncbi:MAG: tetratricopeptide repeat protein [Candidatus Portnoybacteria bacterium]|nr:tetratricopeptide repeat protein [Candidatus Portnoybacteria bacterium]
MSLIHDALRKAQENARENIGSGTANLHDVLGEEKPRVNKRGIILVSLLVLAVGYFAYVRLFSNDDASKQPAPTAAVGQAEQASADSLAAGGPTDPTSLKKRAYDLYRSDDVNGAWANISAAVKLAPQDPEAWNNFGLIAKNRGDLSQAQQAYDKALELKPDYAEAMNNKAMIIFSQGDAGAAREMLEKALALQPAFPEANFNMGLIYDKAGDKEKAKEYYRRFLDVGGSFPSNVVEEVRDRVMELEK